MDGWPGPSRSHPGAGTWHMPDSWARLAGKVCWQVAESQCQDLAPCVLWGLSCHMPSSVPAVELQMGRRGWFAQGGAGSRSGEEGTFRLRELFSGMEGWGWPGGVPAFSHMPAAPPASVPLIPLCPRLEFPSPLVRNLLILPGHPRLHLL